MPVEVVIRSRSDFKLSGEDLAADADRFDLPADTRFEAESNTMARLVVDPDDAITGDDFTLVLDLNPGDGGTFTVNATTNVVTTSAAHNLLVGDAVKFTTSGTLPAPLVAGTFYFVESVPDTNELTLSLAPGGAIVDLTTTGTGTHSWLPYGGVEYSGTYGLPATPVIIRDRRDGLPNDFTNLRAVHLWAVPKDATLNASGRGYLTCGDPSSRNSFFSAPFKLSYSNSSDPDDGKATPSTLIALPEGIPTDPDWPLTLVVRAGESNANLRLFINLCGN